MMSTLFPVETSVDPGRLKPFFSYYGSKWRIAPKYPVPLQDIIVEPFAGSAGFSLRYPQKKVLLLDVDSKICGVWDYLIKASEGEILSLPVLRREDHLDDSPLTQEQKWLIGFNLNRAVASPCKTLTRISESGGYWSERKKRLIASQQRFIRHWQISNASYDRCPDINAYWFIDPPYNNAAGNYYVHSRLDYDHLAAWCRTRRGTAIVCENERADWLDFQPFIHAKAMTKRDRTFSREAIWSNEPARLDRHLAAIQMAGQTGNGSAGRIRERSLS